MLPIDGDFLRAIAPRFSGSKAARQAEIIDAVSGSLRPVLAEYQIDNRLRIAHFAAQIAHESAGFRTTEEFASGAAYEGRADLGNTEPGDGRLFKGRGLIQLTGRANYTTFGQKMGLDLIADPAMCCEPVLSLRIACEYWENRRLNRPADRDDLIAVTRGVNGGLNGLDDRRNYLGKAKLELARIAGIAVIADSPPDALPVLRRGSQAEEVATLQLALRKAGIPVTVDADFGPATELAVITFQTRRKLVPDGVVGPATWAALGV